jgi:hypothetical protein
LMKTSGFGSTSTLGIPVTMSLSILSDLILEKHTKTKGLIDQLQALLLQYFEYVFLFSMNDEVVHAGFSKRAHYLLPLCGTPKGGR